MTMGRQSAKSLCVRNAQTHASREGQDDEWLPLPFKHIAHRLSFYLHLMQIKVFWWWAHSMNCTWITLT